MRKYSGYMTVEASFIIPMVICVFVLIIYFTNYVYARCILSQDSYILAFRAAASSESGKSMEAVVQEKAQTVAGKKYFGNEEPVFLGNSSGKEIVVTGKTTTKHAAMGRYFLKPLSGWKLETSSKAKRREYAKHIRTVKRVRDIVSKEELWNTDTTEN